MRQNTNDSRGVAIQRWIVFAALVSVSCVLTPRPALALPPDQEFRINTSTPGVQAYPSVASRPDGSYVVAWAGNSGVRAQRLGADGGSIGDEAILRAVAYSWWPAVAASDSGGFVVAWAEAGEYPLANLMAQRVDWTGARRGPAFVVTDFEYEGHDLAMSPGGAFVVVWNQDARANGAAGVDQEVAGQRFSRNGAPVGLRFTVDDENLGNQFEPAVAMGSSGDFFVAWTTTSEGWRDPRVLAQHFDPAGTAVGDLLRLSHAPRILRRDPR
jgi:hypothetical protein